MQQGRGQGGEACWKALCGQEEGSHVQRDWGGRQVCPSHLELRGDLFSLDLGRLVTDFLLWALEASSGFPSVAHRDRAGQSPFTPVNLRMSFASFLQWTKCLCPPRIHVHAHWSQRGGVWGWVLGR